MGYGGGLLDKATKGQQGGGWSGSGNGGGWGSDWGTEDKLGFGTRKQDQYAGQMSDNAGQAYQDTQGVLGGMKASDQKYLNDSEAVNADYRKKRDPLIDQWNQKNNALMSESETQGKDAKAAYDNTILPRMKDNMEQAMSLKQAQDSNNAVASNVRGFYNDQAAGATKQGQADYGVLASLGSQATQNAAGAGGPMTGGQMQALQGANMGQAGQAFANAQNYAQSLRTQGINRGFDQSNWAYGQGRQAGQDYQAGIGNDANLQQGFRQEQGDMSNGRYNTSMIAPTQDQNFAMGYKGAEHGFAQNQGNQQIAAIGQKYGVQNAALGMKANAAGATQAGKMGILAAGMGAAGNAMGGRGGGGTSPAGGVAGGMGTAAAGAMGGAGGGGGAPGGDAANGGQGNVNGGGPEGNGQENGGGSEQGAPQQGYQDQSGGNGGTTGGMNITDPNQGRGYQPYGGRQGNGGVYSQMSGYGYQNQNQQPYRYAR